MADDITVMTFNIRTERGLDGRNSWLLRRPSTVEAIRSIGPDVAALQEVRRLQLRYLASHLPEYGFLSRGRANGKKRGEHCPILYRRERFDVERWAVRWYSEQPDTPGSGGRIATLAWLVERAGGAPLSVVSTHLDYRSAANRMASAAALALWLRGWNGPWVAMGDFNATPVEASVANLLGAGFQDVLSNLPPRGDEAGTAHQFTGRLDGPRIDHVLITADLESVEARIAHDRPGGRLPSDHWPVVARLRRSTALE
jgi:endonuclease/exonuclease/phosphatase family metal-dependent hydrolase